MFGVLRRRVGLLVLAALAAAQLAAAAGPALDLSLKGLVKGKAVSGTVRFSRVMCAPLTGKGLQVIWSGDAKVGGADKQVSGDMQFSRTGKSTFGPHGTATASLTVGGNYSDRLATGVAGGSGTATVSSNRKSGTIDARLTAGTSKVQETGSWACG